MFQHCIRCASLPRSILLPSLRVLMVAFFTLGLTFGRLAAAPAVVAEESNWPTPPLTVRAGTFRDAHGRQVILSGINLVDKSVAHGFTAVKGPAVFGQFRGWGFNCVRLGIVWAGVEPQPGKFDEAYLRQVDRAIDWAARHGIYVILDMHQDLYSMKYSDGAPAWATLDEGKPHATGAIWSDAYLMSPAVQTAFDNFWANKPAADGKGLQDHYAAMWRHLAQRYANRTGVIGYDLMNEPFPGSPAKEFLVTILTEFAKVLAQRTGGAPPSPEELLKTWADEASRLKALKSLASAANYARVIDSIHEANQAFEAGSLQPMYRRVADAIREVDRRHVIFLEHSYFCNTGVTSAIRPVLTRVGTPDPQVAYAAHGYDLVTDTKGIAGASNERVQLIFSRIYETGRRTGMPVVLDEWGAYGGSDPALVAPARQAVALIEKFRMGNTYWHYGERMDQCPFFREAILRPYPVCISGDLKEYHFDHAQQKLEVAWQESSCDGFPSVVVLPDVGRVKPQGIVLDPKPGQPPKLLKSSHARVGYLLIYPEAAASGRKLTVTLAAVQQQLPLSPRGQSHFRRTKIGTVPNLFLDGRLAPVRE